MCFTLDCTSAPFVRIWWKDMKCKRVYGGACGGVWESLLMARVWSQAVDYMLVRFRGFWFNLYNLVQRAVFMPNNSIYASCKARISSDT